MCKTTCHIALKGVKADNTRPICSRSLSPTSAHFSLLGLVTSLKSTPKPAGLQVSQAVHQMLSDFPLLFLSTHLFLPLTSPVNTCLNAPTPHYLYESTSTFLCHIKLLYVSCLVLYLCSVHVLQLTPVNLPACFGLFGVLPIFVFREDPIHFICIVRFLTNTRFPKFCTAR